MIFLENIHYGNSFLLGVQYLYDLINLFLDICAPFKNTKITKERKPWITANICLIKRTRNKAFSKYEKSVNNSDSAVVIESKWVYNKQLGNRVTTSTIRKKSLYRISTQT